MWIKTEINTVFEEGQQWEWAPEKGIPAPAINKVFLCTKWGLYILYLDGPATTNILSKLKTKIKPDYFKGYRYTISVDFSQLSISIRDILEHGLMEIDSVLKILYQTIINEGTPSFDGVQSGLEEYICTWILNAEDKTRPPIGRRKIIFFKPGERPSLSSLPEYELNAISPGRSYKLKESNYTSRERTWGKLLKATFVLGSTITVRVIKLSFEPSYAEIVSFTEKLTSTKDGDYPWWMENPPIVFEISFKSDAQAERFLTTLYKDSQVLAIQKDMDVSSEDSDARIATQKDWTKLATKKGCTIEIIRSPGINAAINILYADSILRGDSSLCPNEALLDYAKHTGIDKLDINPAHAFHSASRSEATKSAPPALFGNSA